MKERPQSRRNFLEFLCNAGAGALYPLLLPGILVGGGELESLAYTFLASLDRSRLPQPKLLSSVPNNSVVYGTHPHQNKLETALESAKMIGFSHSIVGFYTGGNNLFRQYPEVLAAMNRTAALGKIPMLSWGEKVVRADIPDIAKQLQQIHSDFLWRPWYEMQGSWARGENGWYGPFTDKEFIDTWRRMRDYFAVHVPHAKSVFSPNATDVAPSFESLFPGEAYVDAIGLDAYSKFSMILGNLARYVVPKLTPQLTFGPDIAMIQQIAPHTPWFLSEVNAAEDAAYLQEALRFAIQAGAFAWMLFEWNKGGTDAWDERDWQASLHPNMLAVVQQELKNPYYVHPDDRMAFAHGLLKNLLRV